MAKFIAQHAATGVGFGPALLVKLISPICYGLTRPKKKVTTKKAIDTV